MDMVIDFAGGKRVDVHFGPFTVHTDQPREGGGDDSAPGPFDLFLASLAACAGYYVLGFCQKRGLPTDGLQLVQRSEVNPVTGHVEQLQVEIQLPVDFPEKYREAVIRAAEQCKVKKHLDHPPVFCVTIRPVEAITP
jgi:putative redox protein